MKKNKNYWIWGFFYRIFKKGEDINESTMSGIRSVGKMVKSKRVGRDIKSAVLEL